MPESTSEFQIRPSDSALREPLVDRMERAQRFLILPLAGMQQDQRTASQAATVRAQHRAKFLGEAAPQLELLDLPLARAQKAFDNAGLRRVFTYEALEDVGPGLPGAFTLFEALGAATAALPSAGDAARLANELSDEYAVVPDFAISLPDRVHATRPERVARGHTAETLWPEESGVATARERGVTGENVLVGVIDTGVDADHVEFAGRRIGYRYVSLHPNVWPPRDVRGFDTDGHGTHVSAIITGNNVGVAPGVELYVASVIESETTLTSMSRVAYSLDWILEQFSLEENVERPAIVNMSLGFPSSLPPGIDQATYLQRLQVIRLFTQELVDSDVLPVVAIGNSGPQSFGFPGGFPESLAAGAVDFDRHVAPFSSSAPSGDVPVPKPDLVGYGVDVLSAIERDYDGQSLYQELSGTSMAAPYVTGIAALYRSDDDSLSVADLRQRLLDSALALPDEDPARVGAGLARFV
jgi:subtilisin family serine protease